MTNNEGLSVVDCACLVGSLHVLWMLQRGGAHLNAGIENVCVYIGCLALFLFFYSLNNSFFLTFF